MRSRDKPGGHPFTGQAVSGIEAARACSAASARNVGRRVPILAPAGCRGVSDGGGWREGERLATEIARRGVPMRNPLADRLVVVVMLL
jgi:hypothetical protein